MTQQTAIEALVEHVATKAVEPETPFAEAIDALKAVTAYLTMARKHQVQEAGQEDEGSFENFRRDLVIAEEPDGPAQVRSRRRTRQSADPN